MADRISETSSRAASTMVKAKNFTILKLMAFNNICCVFSWLKACNIQAKKGAIKRQGIKKSKASGASLGDKFSGKYLDIMSKTEVRIK